MSDVRFPPSSFVGSHELLSAQEFLREYTTNIFKRTFTPGVINGFLLSQEPNNPYFRVTGSSLLIDANLNTVQTKHMDRTLRWSILDAAILSPTIPDTFIKLRYKKSFIEEGTISLDSKGQLSLRDVTVGVDRTFTDLLRGQPQFPTRIALFDSMVPPGTQDEGDNVTNGDQVWPTGDPQYKLGEFDVSTVFSETIASISDGASTVDPASVANQNTQLKYAVVGTFEPGLNPLETNKYIYSYDSCEIYYDSTPVIADEDKNVIFLLGQVLRDSSNGNNVVVRPAGSLADQGYMNSSGSPSTIPYSSFPSFNLQPGDLPAIPPLPVFTLNDDRQFDVIPLTLQGYSGEVQAYIQGRECTIQGCIRSQDGGTTAQPIITGEPLVPTQNVVTLAQLPGNMNFQLNQQVGFMLNTQIAGTPNTLQEWIPNTPTTVSVNGSNPVNSVTVSPGTPASLNGGSQCVFPTPGLPVKCRLYTATGAVNVADRTALYLEIQPPTSGVISDRFLNFSITLNIQ